MSKKPADGNQLDTVPRTSPFIQSSFDLNRADHFTRSLGAVYSHYKAIPSPIGQKDRGDYRRSDGVDTITSNGMIYKYAGKFTATMTDNERSQNQTSGGINDPSHSRLVLPRFYDGEDASEANKDGERIYLAPGDRIYVCDPDADVKVSTYQKMDYEADVDNVPLFPIIDLEYLVDSRNIEYTLGTDFCVTKEGSIRWIAGGNNPGIDPDTGKGRIYSIRYRYKAYWYIVSLPKEIRVTNVTYGDIRKPERMAYFADIVREFVYHNQNKGDSQNQNTPSNPKREVQKPIEPQNPGKYVIPVDMSAIGEDEEQS
jgi:hypothetical protein